MAEKLVTIYQADVSVSAKCVTSMLLVQSFETCLCLIGLHVLVGLWKPDFDFPSLVWCLVAELVLAGDSFGLPFP